MTTINVADRWSPEARDARARQAADDDFTRSVDAYRAMGDPRRTHSGWIRIGPTGDHCPTTGPHTPHWWGGKSTHPRRGVKGWEYRCDGSGCVEYRTVLT